MSPKSPKFFNRERLSPTQESVIRYSFNMISSAVYKIAAAADSKYPNVTQEPIPLSPAEAQAKSTYEAQVTTNQTTANTKLNMIVGNPDTKMHVANAAFAATHTVDSQLEDHMNNLRTDIADIHLEADADGSNRRSFDAS